LADEGIQIDVRDEQIPNAASPRTEIQEFASKTTIETLPQLSKQLRPIESTPDFTTTSRRAWQRAKQNSPTMLTDGGIQIEVRESQE
jgi:hypothetical protein